MGKGSKKALVSIDYAGLPIPRLKQLCREAGISDKGGKLGLVARLERGGQTRVLSSIAKAPKAAKRARPE